ncbi:MAG TPA: antitoxin Xre/MbcA/ParS toxin-binding domain-containing protein [Gemmatimonadota bacterium]|jgi:putative toxin-antitoxin system antitoxin component (TIGR02293 family)
MTPALAIRLEKAHQALDLTWRDLADSLDTTERSVYRWKAGDVAPGPATRRRIEALLDLIDLLEQTFDSPEEARAWLGSRVPALDNRSPFELLKRGRIDEVRETLGRLAHGVFA